MHDHGRDEYVTSNHVDDHEDVHEVPHDHQDDHVGSYSRLPLRPRTLQYGIGDGLTEASDYMMEPLESEPRVIDHDIRPTCVDHHEHESFDPLSPEIPRARRSPRVTRSRARMRIAELSDDDIVMVASRFGEFPLARKLAAELREFHSSHWGVPPHIPVGVEV